MHFSSTPIATILFAAVNTTNYLLSHNCTYSNVIHMIAANLIEMYLIDFNQEYCRNELEFPIFRLIYAHGW